MGLGTGATAAYAKPDQHWTFYEINPAVVLIARNPKYFTYLNECARSSIDIVAGDGRLKLKEVADARYGMILLDAFNGDAIPTHLITQQALDVYLAKLAAGGLLVFHISNRNLDLGPVLADLALSRGLSGVILDDSATRETVGKDPSKWVVLARSPSDFKGLFSPNSRLLGGKPERRVWTDDFSNLLSVFRWA